MLIKKLGVINKMTIKPNNLMLFTGDNNSGKTYTSYLIYGILSVLEDSNFFKIFKQSAFKKFVQSELVYFKIDKSEAYNSYLQQAVKFLNENIKDIAVQSFKISENSFDKLEFEIHEEDIKFLVPDNFNEENRKLSFGKATFEIINDVNEIIIKKSEETSRENFEELSNEKYFLDIIQNEISNSLLNLPQTIYFPAERVGINVFKNELNESRLKTYDTILSTLQYTNLKNSKEKEAMRNKLFRQNFELLYDNQTSNSLYPKPISDYIRYLNTIKEENEDKSKNQISEMIRTDILNGKFQVSNKDNSISFRPKYGKRYKAPLPFHIVSSSIKSLYGLDYYLENDCKSGDVLIIDEPELSLHPLNQVKLAEVVAKIVDSGIRVFLSTHSDLFVRSLVNILIKNKIYNSSSITTENVTVYNFNNGKVEDMKDITKVNYFNNFDDSVIQLQNEYNNLLDYIDSNGIGGSNGN